MDRAQRITFDGVYIYIYISGDSLLKYVFNFQVILLPSMYFLLAYTIT